MRDHELKPQSPEDCRLCVQEKQWSLRKPRRWFSFRWLLGTVAAMAVMMLQALPARPQARPQASPTPGPTTISNPCPPALLGQNLIPVPEIIAKDRKLRGTILLSDEQTWMQFRVPASAPSATSTSECLPQYVRTFRELGAAPSLASAPSGPYSKGSYTLPRPGPTLRARVGDLVQLTFINQINPSNFGNSIDRGEIGGCDESSVYPGETKDGDKFPDCFHGSSTGNIHFHGTHTNPGSTADNVFIEVRPSPRVNNEPTVTPTSVQRSFDEFFANCEMNLSHNVLEEWPKSWSDLPTQWTDEQTGLLKAYDAQLEKNYGSGVRKLWPVDEAQLKRGAWPQYYIGAYPYCFRLPEYTDKSWPPAKPGPMDMGAGMPGMHDGRPLMMGQSPGTHWYHAHKHGSTAINVANGMTGAFIIEGQYDDELNIWYGDGWTQKQKVLVINQLGVSPNLMRRSSPQGGPGPGQTDKGPDFSVNGQLKPGIQMRPGEVQMWRIVNTSGRAGAFFVGPPKGFQWKQLAQDGIQFKDENYQSHTNMSFLLAAGNRADLLVKAPDKPCASPDDCNVIVQNTVDPSDLTSAYKMTLMSVTVSGTPVDPDSHGAQFIPNAPPSFPLFLADITSAEVKGTKKLVFASSSPGGMPTPAMHTIDGKKFDGEVGQVVLLNTVEEWKVINNTVGISHPFHIHINPFQIVEVFDPNEPLIDPTTGKAPIDPKTEQPYVDPQTSKPAVKYAFHRDHLPGQCYLDPDGDPNDWKACDPPTVKQNLIWWDVFPIPSAYAPTRDKEGKVPLMNSQGQPVKVPGYFKMRSRFVDYAGFFVIHCHILAHEDRGMMTIVEVAPIRTPYAHH